MFKTGEVLSSPGFNLGLPVYPLLFTQGYTHTYTFMGWVTPGKYDYAYIVDNQARSFGGQVFHVRSTTDDPVHHIDGMAFFMYF
ncbi:hypothetical protein [Desulfosporosinus fructosivorans]|uniref:hypothetical protein n=1 Tax=Desulfosporosinus fructosivorans TaxID=2018669 RepID=UPI001FB091C1|nr:hypothetical protein [Desulfosporosinus fructosivorans]